MKAKLPNILCLVSEDCPPRLGAYGDALARTPNIDTLAQGGLTWEVCCCTSPVCAPSRFAILTGLHAECAPPAQHMSSFAPAPPGIVTYPQLMRQVGYYCTNNYKTHYNCDIDPATIWDETSISAHWRDRPEGAPFLSVFNCMDTHESRMFEDFPGAVQPADVTLPAYLPDTPGIRSSLASYYNCIAQMDAFIGDRLSELEEDGLADDTIVFYYSDHGSPLPRSKRFCYDEGLRVPLILRVPRKWRKLPDSYYEGRMKSPASLVDLMPTFAAIAGVQPPARLHGTNLLENRRRFAFSGRNRMDEHPDMIRTVRSDRFRYIRNYAPHRIWGQYYAFAWLGRAYQEYEAEYQAGTLDPIQQRFWERKSSEELYDMASDPDAIRNLAGDPTYAPVLDEMRSALDAHMIDIHDCGFIPEGMAIERPELANDGAYFPLPEVIQLAGVAIRRDPDRMVQFVDGLGHESAVMRFWAAQGILMLAIEGHAPPPSTAAHLSHETDPFVRIPLMEALGHGGDLDRQVSALTQVVRQEEHPKLRLLALDALHYLPFRPELSLPAIMELVEDEDEYLRGAAGYLHLRMTDSYRPDAQVFRFDLFKPVGNGTPVEGTEAKTSGSRPPPSS